MSITELSGQPADPDCLHCYLAPLIDAWKREHAGKPPVHVILEVAQVLGELVGSEAFSSGHSACVPTIVNGAMRETLRTAIDLVNTLKRRRV